MVVMSEERSHLPPELSDIITFERLRTLAFAAPVGLIILLLFGEFFSEGSPLSSLLGIIFLSAFVTIFSFLLWIMLAGYPRFYRHAHQVFTDTKPVRRYLRRIGRRRVGRGRYEYFVLITAEPTNNQGVKVNVLPTPSAAELEALHTRSGGWPLPVPVEVLAYVDLEKDRLLAFQIQEDLFWMKPDLQALLP